MLNMIVKFVLGAMCAVGFLLVLGAAGSDCDGKCMENAMPLGTLILYSLGGITMIAVGAFGLIKMNEEV
jgi:hypothetical protein